jgi:integrase/recombinase XerD
MTQFGSEHELAEYSDLLNSFLEFALGKYESDRSYQTRERGVRAWLHWCERERVDPLQVSDGDIHSYITDLNTEYADTTIASRVSSVTVFYDWAISEPDVDTVVDENPTADLNLKDRFGVDSQTPQYIKVLRRKGQKNVKALPKERVESLFPHAGRPSVRNELLVRLLWQTALRCDEVSRIKLDNIDWDNRQIRVRSSKLNPDDHPDLYHRYVYWEPDLDLLMKEWVEGERKELGPYHNESEYLFLTDQSPQMRPSHISRIVKEAAFEAGEQEPMGKDGNGHTRWLITGHRIRHSAISHWANETDIDIHLIRKVAGHAQLDTTMDYVTTDWETVRKSFHENR